MAIEQRKSYLKVGTSRRKKKIILSLVGIAVLIISLAIVISKINIDLSWLKNLFATIEIKSINIAQIIVLIAGGIAIFCFAKYKNIILLITTIFYGVICFITFGGINIMNSYWFWIFICIAELIAIITTYISTGDSFFSCFESVFFQLFGLVPIWFLMYCLCSYAAEKGNAELENLFYLILQFATFAVVLGYQLIMIFSNGNTGIDQRDITVDMTGDEDDGDWDDL